MPAIRQRLVDLLAMGRVANVPSVLCNTFLGAVLAWWLSDAFDPFRHLPYAPNLVGPLLAALCFYLGGCFLNDWHDVAWDREHRPERAIPAGRSTPLGVGILAFSLLGAGLALSFLQGLAVGIVGLGILTAIAIYTLIHKRSAWGVLPMGLCRALLYPLGFLAQPDPVAYGHRWPSIGLPSLETETKIAVLTLLGLGLLSYIAGLSLFARHESKGTLRGNTRLLAFCLLALPLLTHSCIWVPRYPLMVLLGMAPFASLLLLPLLRSAASTEKRIGLLLASIPLVDFICLPALAESLSIDSNWIDSAGSHLLTSPFLLCAVPLVAYLLARLLQRLAPAS